MREGHNPDKEGESMTKRMWPVLLWMLTTAAGCGAQADGIAADESTIEAASVEASSDSDVELAGTGCPQGSLCVYEHADYQGSSLGLADRPLGTCRNLPGDWVRRISSVSNRLPRNVIFFSGTNCTGSDYHVRTNDRDHARMFGFNDRAVSVWYGG
jgi:hypothetical protein